MSEKEKKSICNIISLYKNYIIFNVYIDSLPYIIKDNGIKYIGSVKKNGSSKRKILAKKILFKIDLNKNLISNNMNQYNKLLLKKLKEYFNNNYIELCNGIFNVRNPYNECLGNRNSLVYHNSSKNLNRFIIYFYEKQNMNITYFLRISYDIFNKKFKNNYNISLENIQKYLII